MLNNIKHLYQRAGFGATPEEWRQAQTSSLEATLEKLFTEAKSAPPLTVVSFEEAVGDTMTDRRKAGRLLAQQYRQEWFDRMADPTESALLERLTLFWHDHFACRTVLGHIAIKQLNTLREHALGSFRDLCLAMARDPSMIRYLNNLQNKKNSPNENFARELLELFTIGRGHYTEQDVKEAARAFTGWGATYNNYKGEFRFRAREHDYGEKTFFGQTGRFNGEDIIKIILDRRASADFLVRKFWDYYVSAPVDEQILETLSRTYYESDYNTEALLRSMFGSSWFYEARFQAGQIKSPVVLLTGIRRTLAVEFDQPRAQARLLQALGQAVFNPPNVAGWPGGRQWIDNSTLMLRLNIGASLLSKRELNLPGLEIDSNPTKRRLAAVIKLEPLLAILPGGDLATDFTFLTDYLLPGPVRLKIDRLAALVDGAEGEERLRRMLLVLFSLPEFQTC